MGEEELVSRPYSDPAAIRLRRSLHPAPLPNLRRSMIRTVFILLDLSLYQTHACSHLPPTKLSCMVSELQTWLHSFFSSNPCSRVAILGSSDSQTLTVCPLTSSMELLLSSLNSAHCSGQSSVSSLLTVAQPMIKSLPPYTHPEVLLFHGGTSIPSGLDLDSFSFEDVTVTCVCLESEIYALRRLVDQSSPNSRFIVPLNKPHLQQSLQPLLIPPPSLKSSCQMVEYGFPSLIVNDVPSLVQDAGGGASFSLSLYQCPRCHGGVASCPGSCAVCGLKVVNATDLSKGYRSIFPLPTFEEAGGPEKCEACGCTEDVVFRCKECGGIYCWMCDEVLHEDIGCCPGCLQSG